MKIKQKPLDTSVLGRFKMWEGLVRGGFFATCLGTMTRSHYNFSPNERWNAWVAQDRWERPEVFDGELILDLCGVLEAVDSAHDKFTMAALGAGWGRWLVIGAAAAKQRSLVARLVGLEAEPTHFEWLVEHFRDNALDPGEHVLLNAAAGAKPGEAWFSVGEPDTWYGQSIVPDGQTETRPDGIRVGWSHPVKRVPVYDLAAVVELAGTIIDYMHLDIQGMELQFLGADRGILDRNVRRVVVGTHSSGIEAGLRDLFTTLGWQCEFDYPMNSSVAVGQTKIALQDGSQDWVNPCL